MVRDLATGTWSGAALDEAPPQTDVMARRPRPGRRSTCPWQSRRPVASGMARFMLLTVTPALPSRRDGGAV